MRELVKPGLTSSWVINGSHKLTFKKWMELDLEYINNAKLTTDISIIAKTAVLVIKSVFH